MRISDWSSDVCSSDLVGTRHRDVVDRLLAEMEEVAQHLALDGREVADDAAAPALAPLLFGLVDRLLDLFAQARLAIAAERSEEHTSELQSLMRISYAVFCLKKKKNERSLHTYTKERKNRNMIHKVYTNTRNTQTN